MIKKTALNPYHLGVPLLLILFLFAIPRIIVSENLSHSLSIGILLDLLITIPLLYYFIIRKTSVPKFTVIYPFLLGLGIASIIIPTEHQQLLTQIKLIAIPVIELSILTILIFKFRQLNKSFKNATGQDFFDKLLIACNDMLPNRLGKLLATEIAVFYYLFSFSTTPKPSNNKFSYFKKSGIKSVISILIFLLIIETFAVHLLLEPWNSTVAWTLTILGLYAMLQIIAVMKSLKRRLICFNYDQNTLRLNYGFGCQTEIPFNQIKSIEATQRTPKNIKGHVCLSLFDMLDSKNILIELSEEQTLFKLYGIEKKYHSISVYIDEKELFIDKVHDIIQVNAE